MKNSNKNGKTTKIWLILLIIILTVLLAVGAVWTSFRLKDKAYSRMIEDSVASTVRDASAYYDSLDVHGKYVYNAIVFAAENIWNETETMSFDLDKDEFAKIVDAVRGDRPELFYVDFDSLVLQRGTKAEAVKAEIAYLADTADIADMKSRFEKAVDTVCKEVKKTGGKDVFVTELAAHDALVSVCSIASEADGAFANTAYGALVDHKAFCDGYAYAYKTILAGCGIESYVVYGKVDVRYDPEGKADPEYEDHAWNIVKRDGEYYHTDVLWDDPDSSGLASEGLVFHGYFDLDRETIAKDHVIEDPGVVPEAKGADGYYVHQGYYSETNVSLTELLTKLLKEAAAEKKGCIELMCGGVRTSDDLREAYKAAVSAVNAEAGREAVSDAFGVFPASAVTGAMTVQVIYPTAIETTLATDANGMPVLPVTLPPETEAPADTTTAASSN